MSLTEKTLELNITHELLTVADRLWDLIYFSVSAPVLIHRCHCNRPVRLPPRLRPPFASGLSLQDEEGRGWDVKIELPAGWPGARAIFLQFKRGYHTHFSTKRGSIFYGTRARRSPRRPHCTFGVNNNKERNQHLVLGGLAGNPSLARAVHYAFPRVSTRSSFLATVGRLTAMTSFFRVDEIDALAARHGISFTKGTSHDFAVSYCGASREIRSNPVSMTDVVPNDAAVIGDVVTTRVWRALVDWSGYVRDYSNEVDFEQVNWRAVFDHFLVDLARFLVVRPSRLPELVRDQADPESLSGLDDSFAAARGAVEEQLAPVLSANELGATLESLERHWAETFDEVTRRLMPLRATLAQGAWFEAGAVDLPAAKASVDVPPEGLELPKTDVASVAIGYVLF